MDNYLRRPDGSIYGTRTHKHRLSNDGGSTDRSDADGNMLCNDCGAPVFWCDVEGWYFHVNADVPACFLATSDHPY